MDNHMIIAASHARHETRQTLCVHPNQERKGTKKKVAEPAEPECRSYLDTPKTLSAPNG